MKKKIKRYKYRVINYFYRLKDIDFWATLVYIRAPPMKDYWKEKWHIRLTNEPHCLLKVTC